MAGGTLGRDSMPLPGGPKPGPRIQPSPSIIRRSSVSRARASRRASRGNRPPTVISWPFRVSFTLPSATSTTVT